MQMERSVADQVAEEARALKASQTATMRVEVERKVAEERAALTASLRQQSTQVRQCRWQYCERRYNAYIDAR